MSTFDWIAAAIVCLPMIYISALTVAEWFRSLQRGEAVTLLPERRGGTWPLWTQVAMIALGLVLFAVLMLLGWVPLFSASQLVQRLMQISGLILTLAGLGLVFWARRTLGKYWGVSTSQQVKLLDDHRLIQSGPYAWVRHPMYFGAWVWMLGITLVYPVWATLLLFISMLIAFGGRARREEAALAERFGAEYQEYKKRTRYLIPFIY